MTGADLTSDVYQSLQAALDMFQSSPSQTSDSPGKHALVQAAEQVKTDAAKIGLMCSGSTLPKDQLVSLAAALQSSAVTFCTLCHAATATAGPTLKDYLVKLAHDLVNSCLLLIQKMGSGDDLKGLVGQVWGQVAAVSKAPLDNKACLFAALAKVVAVLKDTLREMQELQEAQQEQYGQPERPLSPHQHTNDSSSACDEASAEAASSAATSSGTSARPGAGNTAGELQNAHGASISDGQAASRSIETRVDQEPCRDELQQQTARALDQAGTQPTTSSSALQAAADLDFEAEEMSYWERQVLGHSIQLMMAAVAVLRAFGRVLLQGKSLVVGGEALDGWESCLWHSRHLQRAVEDLGAAQYPPQDLQEVLGAAQAMFDVTELMLEECPDLEAVGAADATRMSQDLAAAHERLQNCVQDAQKMGGRA